MATPTKKPTCRNWQILLGEYALDTISTRDRARLERHLAQCRHCRKRLAETQKIYAAMADFELAKPSPFFAAKVDRAVRETAGLEAPRAERKRWFELGRWWRSPAFATAAGAAALAVVATVLYLKVWVPYTATAPLPPPAKETATVPVEKRDTAPPAPAEKDDAAAREVDTSALAAAETPPGEELVRGEEFAESPDVVDDGVAAPAPTPEVAALLAASETEGEFAGAGRRDEARARESAGGVGFGAGFAAPAEEALWEEAPFAGAGYAGFAAPHTRVVTAAEVEAWMDARFEADVELLTGEDDAALLDYVTPDATLMTYFYELSAEEQEELLSRLRREAEEAPPAETFLFH
ncbi:MAG: zf-HC2 domain-containing protein [Candidatus Coatesbacteria bacterium]|nr:MAG: zf-HC2 domain-containing protein [Candidatus Coatesbacteria bacterium]